MTKDSKHFLSCHFHCETSPSSEVSRNRQTPESRDLCPEKLPVISQPDDNILVTSPLLHHLTGWSAAAVIARPLIVIGDCGRMLIMVSTLAIVHQLCVFVGACIQR